MKASMGELMAGLTLLRIGLACECRYDGTVRNAVGEVIQFLYGEDGMEGTAIEGQRIDFLRWNKRKFAGGCNVLVGALAGSVRVGHVECWPNWMHATHHAELHRANRLAAAIAIVFIVWRMLLKAVPLWSRHNDKACCLDSIRAENLRTHKGPASWPAQ